MSLLSSLSSGAERWLLPPAVASIVRARLSGRRANKDINLIHDYLRRNAELKNKHLGQKCFVIGNGPSLSQIDLSLIKDEVTIACNYFFKHSECKTWSPSYYCTGDPIESWIKTDKPGIIAFQNYWRSILAHTKCQSYLLHVGCAKYLPSDILQSEADMRFWYRSSPLDESAEENFTIDFATGRHTPIYLTPMLSINLAMYLGCNPIYLLGCDNSYLTDYLAGKYTVSHFYQEDAHKSESLQMPLSKILYDTYISVYGFEILQQYAMQHNILIFDLSVNGFLRCFPKMNFDDIAC